MSNLQIQILGIRATNLMAQALFCRHLQTCLELQNILGLLRYQQCYHCTKGWLNNIFLTIEQMLPLHTVLLWVVSSTEGYYIIAWIFLNSLHIHLIHLICSNFTGPIRPNISFLRVLPCQKTLHKSTHTLIFCQILSLNVLTIIVLYQRIIT